MQGPLGLIAPPEIAIDCEAFTGTLGTLIRCVLHQKVDLWDIPLRPICQAFLDYVLESQTEDVDSAATALLAMAFLVERKAFRLLPLPEVEAEFEDEVYAGPEILDFKEALNVLEARFEERQDLFFRSVDMRHEYEVPVELGSVTTADLGRALQTLLDKAVDEPNLMMSKPRRSLAEQMRIVDRCLGIKPMPLVELVEGVFNRQEALWWFLALLELMRLGTAGALMSEDGEVRFHRIVSEVEV